MIEEAMPYTLNQLQERRDSCIKKIQELKATAEDKGCKEKGDMNFSSSVFWNELFTKPLKDLDFFFIIFSSIS